MALENNNNPLDTTNAAKYLEISERSFRWYRSEYNKENTNDPLNPIKEGIKHLYSESDLEKLKTFIKSRKKSTSVNKINEIKKTSHKVEAHDLKIDEGYRTLIRSLSEQEFTQLEENILQNGILNPIIVTKDYTVIDGYNRYAIAKKHDLPIPIKIMDFRNRNEIEIWIIKNQIAQRNLSAYDRGVLALKLKPIISAIAKQNQKNNLKLALDPLFKRIDTKKEIAKIAEISHGTLAKIEKIDNEATDEMKQSILNGKLSIDKAYKQIMGSSYSSLNEDDNPFSDEEVKLLDDIETAAAHFVLFIHINKVESQKANINLEKCKEKLNVLANNAKKSGNRKHYNLLIKEKEARIKHGTDFGTLYESKAEEYIQGKKNYEPVGNKSIVLAKITSKVTIEDYRNLITSIKVSTDINEIKSLIGSFEKEYGII